MFYEVRQVVSNHVAAVAPAVVIGAACGLAAVVFTIANLKCSRLRSHIIGVGSHCPGQRLSTGRCWDVPYRCYRMHTARALTPANGAGPHGPRQPLQARGRLR